MQKIQSRYLMQSPYQPFGQQAYRKNLKLGITRQIIKNGQEVVQIPKTISTQTYFAIFEDMKKELQSVWRSGDKVTALTIAIQATKLLHDTSNTQFQAVKFAYVIDIVQRIGLLVFQRIKALTYPSYRPQKLNQITIANIVTTNVPQSAQEICRNWLIKIASIREVMPRCIIQTTLLRLYFFLDKGFQASKVLKRLARSNRCFGQSVNCLLFCTFLIKVASQLVPKDKTYLKIILGDVFNYMRLGQVRFGRSDMNFDQYMLLIEPFFKTAFKALSINCDDNQFLEVINYLPTNPHFVVLKSLLNFSSITMACQVCVQLAHLIRKTPLNFRFKLLSSLLSKSCCKHLNARELAGVVYQQILLIEKMPQLLQILGPFTQLINKNYQGAQKTSLFLLVIQKLNQIAKKMNRNDIDLLTSKIKDFIASLLDSAQDSSELVVAEPVLQMISYFKLSGRRALSKQIFELIMKKESLGSFREGPLVVMLMSFCKNLYDCNDIEQPGAVVQELIVKFINRTDFKSNIEGQLNFYVEIRASFGTIPRVAILLIRSLIRLIRQPDIKRRAFLPSVRKFLQACLAFCIVTISLIDTQFQRIGLYLQSSKAGLQHNLIAQADTLLKLSVSTLVQVPLEWKKGVRDDLIMHQIKQILNLLIVFPDDPNGQYLFMLNGTLNAVQIIQWAQYPPLYRAYCFLLVLPVLNAQAQSRLPVHVKGVSSNDELFKGKEVRSELQRKGVEIIQRLKEISQQLKTLKGVQVQSKLNQFYYEGVTVLLLHTRFSQSAALLLQLWWTLLKRGWSPKKDKSAIVAMLEKEVADWLRENQ